MIKNDLGWKLHKNKKRKYLFHCEISNEYVSSIYICDGINDCLDKSDEKNCKIETLNYFNCDKTEKIHISLLCNFIKDCKDGSDEKFCRSYYI